MNTEQTAQQLELAAKILRTGHPWELWTVGQYEKPDQLTIMQCLERGHKIRPILATPPDNRPIHNPDNLTAEQVGVGWRLALKGEKVECESTAFWYREGNEWLKTAVTAHATGEACFRLPISVPWPEPQPDPYAALKKAHAEGKVIQSFNHERGIWQDCPSPAFEGGTDYRIKPEPAFQLPPPPPGMRWHREDGWKADDLPQGYRPLVDGEREHDEDEYCSEVDGEWILTPDVGRKVGQSHKMRTTRPLTFTHAGKTWTYHRPGDPMPCDGDRNVYCLVTKGDNRETGCTKGRYMAWSVTDETHHFWGVIIGWRYADEKKTVPLGPEDVLPGSVFRFGAKAQWITPLCVSFDGIGMPETELNRPPVQRFSYDLLQDAAQINRSIPLTGKWNPDAWEPCHKQIDA